MILRSDTTSESIKAFSARFLLLWCWCACDAVGGDQRRVEIHLIAHPDDDQMQARRRLTEQFATFDAGKAQCFLAKDRERLLAVIEAGFGDFYDFNRVARSLFASRLHDRLTSHSSGLSAGGSSARSTSSRQAQHASP